MYVKIYMCVCLLQATEPQEEEIWVGCLMVLSILELSVLGFIRQVVVLKL